MGNVVISTPSHRIDPPEPHAPSRNAGKRPTLGILYQDDELLAVDKPAGLSATVPRDEGESLLEVLRRQVPADLGENLRLVHRLDRFTSGVMVVACSVEAQRRLSKCFEDGQARKCYWALVAGRPPTDEGLIDLPIGSASGTPGLMRVDRQAGRAAQTAWRVLERFAGMALLECRPLTGRTHQIRVHLKAIGLPLRVDPQYGSGEGLYLSSFKSDYHPSRRRAERPLIERLTLHARSLELPPRSGDEPIRLEAPLPRDLKAALTQLGKHASLEGAAGLGE